MNTGVQRSSATPPAARTANTKPVGDEPGNVFGQGKSAPLIAMAHEIPYVATATVADLHDLEHKIERAMELRGARYVHVLVPCPLGWGSAAADTIRIARLARETGLFPVLEAEHGEVVSVSKIRRPCPGRGVPAHAASLRPPLRRASADRRHRADPGASPTGTSAASASSRRHDGEAVRNHPGRRLEPRQQDGQLADRAPGLRPPAAAVRERLPGGRERAAVALRRRGGRRRLRARLAADHGGQPLPGRDGPGLLPPVRDRLQPRAARRGRRDQLGRAVPRGRGDRARLAGRRHRAALGQARARRRRRPVRPLRRVPPRPPRTRGDDRSTPARGRAG